MIKSYRVDNEIHDINTNLLREIVRLVSFIYVEEGYFKPESAHRFSKAREQAIVMRMAVSILDIFTAEMTEDETCKFKFTEYCMLRYDKKNKTVTLIQDKLSYSATISSFEIHNTDYEVIDEIDGYVYSLLTNVRLIDESCKTNITVIQNYLGVSNINGCDILNYLISVKSCLDKAIKITLY